MASNLWQNHSYLNKNITHILSSYISEYDIAKANIHVLYEAGVITKEQFDYLYNADRMTRQITIGNMIKKNRNVYTIIQNGIIEAKKKLFIANEIQDYDVLSIKNDAVFIIGSKLKYTKFGPFEFKPKHQYAAYMMIDKIEFYYDKKNRSITVKGVRDEVVNDPDHQKGIVQFFLKIFKYLVMDQRQDLWNFLIDFVRQYKAKELPFYYYKEFNGDNIYRTIIELAGFEYNLTEIGEDDLDIINPIYNYTRYILPIIRMFM